LYQRSEADFGQGGGAAVLTLNRALPRLFTPETITPVEGWRARLAEIDLVVDLGARIGSREWWRGLATCTALVGSAFLLHPRPLTLLANADAPLSDAHWEEARALSFSPIAYGADTGRGMAATDAVEPLADTPERPTLDLVATLGQGDGFARSLERAGVAPDAAQSVTNIVSGAVDTGDIPAGTRMDLTLGRRPSKAVPRPLDHLAFRARFDLKLVLDRVDGRLGLKRIPIAVDYTPLRIQGVVGSSLYLSARAAGVPAKAVETYIRALSSRMAIGRDVHSDDSFDIIVEHKRAETGESETGALLYAGLNQGRRQTRLLKWTVGGSSQWYEASGVGEHSGGMTKPVANAHETSGFGMRFHPILGYSRFHKGVDFGAPYGSPIVATTAGTISYSGWHGGHGNYVMINHGGGMQTGYGHMSRIVAHVGEHVAQGQLIGYVGSTGLSTGPHLHYEVYKNGVAINPLSVTFSSTTQLAGSDLARFKATLAQLMAVRPGAGNAPFTAPRGEKTAASSETKRTRG
jgi:murein DD-endopeptidase MepM/ murein hydrolase activator NlpD